jgi:hypothetical protein
MKPILIYFLTGTLIITGIISCDKSNIKPENIFTKIYDDQNSDISYYPLDIAESGSDGYFILGATAIDTTRTWLNTYIARTDKVGEIEWSVILERPYINPVSNLIYSGGEYYIFCMDDIALSTHVLRIDNSGQTAVHVKTFDEIIYPLAVSKTPDNGFLLLNYDRTSRSSRLSKIDASLNISWQSDFRVNEDAEGILVEHLIKTGKNIPFFTGSVGTASATHYYANAFYNYTLSLVFVNASNGDRTGVAQGFLYKGGASSLLSIQSNTFALSRFSFGENYILPSINIDINSISVINDLGGGALAEIEADSETRLKKMTIDGNETIVFATNTNSNQVIIYAYDITGTRLLFKKYLGFSNPVKVGSIIQTSDGGIGILVQTMVAGRFKRLGFYKIPKEYLN